MKNYALGYGKGSLIKITRLNYMYRFNLYGPYCKG